VFGPVERGGEAWQHCRVVVVGSGVRAELVGESADGCDSVEAVLQLYADLEDVGMCKHPPFRDEPTRLILGLRRSIEPGEWSSSDCT
jgi:hypothetical protein